MSKQTDIRTFEIDIPQADLDDLRERLARTRWTRRLPGDGWSRGVSMDYLQELVEYWRNDFDWRVQEDRLNAFPQYVTEIDGLDVHFLHVRSSREDALPLLLCHGWPNSFVEFARLIEPLTEPASDDEQAFHVVVPSIPGFGFSAGPVSPGFGVAAVGRMFAELMMRLGYERYGVQGGDLGAYIAPEVARADPEHVTGVYVVAGLGFPTSADLPDLSADERAVYEQIQQWSGGVDHHGLLRVAPQSFAFGWDDSPTGLLAWHMQKFGEFTFHVPEPDQAIDRDLLLTNTSLYWFTRTSGTSSWFMYDNTAFAWPEGQKLVPTGVYAGPPGIRRLAERKNQIVHWPSGNPGGGHFLAMELPEALAKDLRVYFGEILA